LLTVTLLAISPEEALVRAGAADGKSAWIFQPFDDSPAAFAGAIAGDRVFTANETGDLALFDFRTRTCLRRGSLGRKWKKLHGLVLRDGTRIVLYTTAGLTVVDGETLDVVLDGHGLRAKQSEEEFDVVPHAPVPDSKLIEPIRIDYRTELVEHDDGTLIASSTVETEKAGPVHYSLLVFDLLRRTATRLVAQTERNDAFENHFRWFSPSGRYGIRFHYGSIPWHDGRKTRRYVDIAHRILGTGGRSELPDCKLDGEARLGTTLEVWQTKPLKPVAKPVARMWPANTNWRMRFDMDYMKQFARAVDFVTTKPGKPHPNEMDFAYKAIVCNPWKLMNTRIECLAWEPDERAFWILYEGHVIRRVTLDGQVSPMVAVGSVRDSRLKRYRGATFNAGRNTLQPLGDDRVRITLGGDHIVHIAFPSMPTIGVDTVPVPESFIPGVPLDRPLSDSALSELAIFTRTFIEMPDLSEASILAAIETLTNRIATALPDMVHYRSSVGHHVRTLFFAPTHVLSERAFFDFAAERYPATIPALRRLVMTYVSAPKPHPPNARLRYTDNEGALAHAALALARFDPDAGEVLFAYVVSPNVGQSSFIRDDLAPAYFEHQGWQGESGVRVGVRFAIAEHSHSIERIRHYWEKIGLREAARELSPALFAHILLTERTGPRSELDKKAIITTWLEVLEDKTNAFDAAVKSALLADLHSTGPEAIVRLRDAVAFIEATSPNIDHMADSFRLLEIRNQAHALLSAREFGDLIVAATSSRAGAALEDRSAARIIHVIRSIAETLDAANDYDAEVLQVLRGAMKDTVARLRLTERPQWSTPRWFTHLLLHHLEWVHQNKDRDDKRTRVVVIIEDLCRIPDPGEPFDAEVIAALREASQEKEPWKWRGWQPKATPASAPEA
jgi:hypothetical protein